MLIDLHSHQPAECRPGLLRIESLRPLELELRGSQIKIGGYYSCGLHPGYEADMTPMALERLTALAQGAPRLCAIGEAGLDNRSPVPMPLQREMLERQVELSERLGLPLVVHCVGAWGLLIQTHRQLSPVQPWVIHGYRRGVELAGQLLSRGMWLSFGALHQGEALALAYEAGRMMLETDASDVSIEDVYASATRSLGLEPHTLELTLEEALRQELLPHVGALL